MGKIIERNYDVDSNLNKKLVVLSDVHYYSSKDLKKLNKVLNRIRTIKPDYICIPGDLLDEAYICDEDDLINWLSELKDISKVIMGIGNHELFVTKKHIPKINKELINKIKAINNIVLLDNNIYRDNNINFIGITMPFDYYYKLKEDSDYFINYFNIQFGSIDDGYNILLCHSPIAVGTKKVLENLKIGDKLNLILSGHMHGGITPNFLKRLLKGRGLISPRKKILEKNCYGHQKVNNTDYIISCGITVASHLNSFHFLDCLFSSEIPVICLK